MIPRRRLLRLPVVLLALSAEAGCASFRVGYRAPAPEVAAPIFENRTLRRGYEHVLATHLRRRILDATPMHLAREGSGAPIVKGAIVSVREGVLVPNLDDRQAPTESSITITVEVALVDPKRGSGQQVLVGADADGDDRPDGPARITETESFVPTFGQSRDTAADRALKKIAERIVDLLEGGWGGAQER